MSCKWMFGKPFDHSGSKLFPCTRILGPEEVVLESDGLEMAGLGKLFCVPLNWIGRLAGNCERAVYRIEGEAMSEPVLLRQKI